MPKKILLADDSLTIQKVVELTFSDSDFELVCVSNGQRALEKVREERPDLILADVVMPEKNGYEVCETIKGDAATAKIPVVLLSGTFEPFDRERAERIGADAIVSKPFDSQQLLSQVEALLARAPKEALAPASGATTVIIPVTSLMANPPSSAEAEEEEGPVGVAEHEPPPIPIRQATEPIPRPAEEPPPFEAGFTAEDFTGTVRLPASAEPADPFEEEYGRGGVDSAIEAFEKVQPDFGFAGESEIEIDDDRLTAKSLVEEGGGAPPQWLTEEPERTAPMPSVKPPPPPAMPSISGDPVRTAAAVWRLRRQRPPRCAARSRRQRLPGGLPRRSRSRVRWKYRPPSPRLPRARPPMPRRRRVRPRRRKKRRTSSRRWPPALRSRS
jgi:CheY-like chemotaxis protein